MKKTILLSLAIILGSLAGSARTLSEPMEQAIDICTKMSDAIGVASTAELRAANKALKAADISDFSLIRLHRGKELSLDGHFLFDEVFVDSLINNRVIIGFASRYARARTARSASGKKGRIMMTTRALAAGRSAIWKAVNKNTAEYALIAEPGGLFTITIRDERGNVLYADTVDNKTGARVRRATFELPDKSTRIYIEVKNNSDKDSSFALLSN